MKPDQCLISFLLGFNSGFFLQKASRRYFNWEQFTLLSLKESVGELFYQRLKENNLTAKIPLKAKALLKERYYKTAARNIFLMQECEKLFGIFSQKNIDLLALKGIFLMENAYKNPALRPMTDIDLLIKRHDLIKTDELLCSMGYLPLSRAENFLKMSSYGSINNIMYKAPLPLSYFLHIHWHIVNSTWPVARFAQSIDIKQIWENAGTSRVCAKNIFVLSPDDLILHLCFHGLLHGFNKLILLADLACALSVYKSEIAFGSIYEKAKKWRIEPYFYYAANLINNIFEKKLFDIDSFSYSNILLGKLAALKARKRYVSYIVLFLSQEGAASKTKFIKRTFLPDKSVLVHKYNIPFEKITAKHYLRRALGGLRTLNSQPFYE
ncbi:MAG: nucleotidyltransferase family protein [Candidatus Omnitrophota bacterium]